MRDVEAARRHPDQAGLRTRGPRRARRRPRHRAARRVSVHARHPQAHVPRPAVDDAPVHRLRHAGGDERALQVPDGARPGRAQRRLRPADAARSRLRRSARRGRGGPRRHGDRHAGRHGGGVRRHPARPRERLAHHQRHGGADHRHVLRGRRAAGRRRRPRGDDAAERHPQGVRRARHLDLPGRALAAARRRPHRVLGAPLPALEPGLGVRLPHPRGRLHDRAGDGVRPGHRRRLRRADARRGAWPSTSSRRASPSTSRAWGKIFEEVAKFRAGRRLYARMLRERFGAPESRSRGCSARSSAAAARPSPCRSPRTTSCAAPTSRWPAR